VQIVQVDLENVKSYTWASVPFRPGINAICGENGAGKSTVLEAIGFAMFGHSPFKRQDQIVREGEKTATITVRVLGNDERAYQIVRKAGGTNQHYVYDPELEQKLADGVDESTAWLREFAGVDEGTDLAKLFSDAVGVPQGMLTTPFLLSAGPRGNVFNPLLRVDEYKRAAERLRESRSWLDYRCRDCEKQIAGFEAETRHLPNKEGEAEELIEATSRGEARRSDLQYELEETTSRKEAIETIKARLAACRRSSF
jgi:DNA repair protein SbcC/Rad50